MATLFDVLDAHRTNKKDKKKFGLVVQGGGMRAVYSCGALTTLGEYGFSDTFQHIVGSSAGAFNAGYFLANYKNPTILYTKDSTTKKFVNLLRTDKQVDVDYIIDEVMQKKRPMNLEELRKSHTKLHVVLTDAETGKSKVISEHKNFAGIYEEFRATAALPIIYDKKIKIGPRYYIDGGVSDLLPLDVAIKLGCSDIVVILTQQLSSFRLDGRRRRLVNHLIKKFSKNQSDAVRKILPTNERILKINLRRMRRPFKKVRIYLIQPSDEKALVTLATIDKPKIESLAKLGIKDMDVYLHQPVI